MKQIETLEKTIGYTFKNRTVVKEALTHSSHGTGEVNNERLEYLGDAVLELTMSEYLFKMNCYNEGQMTKLRASIVCSESLSKAAAEIGLGEYLLLGKGEAVTGGRKRKSNLANAFEAVLGAVFMDSNYETAKALILRLLKENIHLALTGRLNNDYKTELQEQIQKQSDNVIEYALEEAEGPEHNKTFHVSLLINGNKESQGLGKTKKEAEQHAAKQCLMTLLAKEENPCI
ncbi:MAG: ribonuclease III [Eubacteriaceae bacterium]|jgi:ribonuclease-3|nr:ribonuclease III [Eubacteriaceae bacterium]MDD4507901.1 ribonuclease III [Eubacteriaceae bacterium]